jgi:hypothetical protein
VAGLERFRAAGASVDIEVSEAEGSGGPKDIAELGRTVAAVAAALAKDLGKIEADNPPRDVAVRFGVNALTGGGFAVVAGGETAIFRVTMTWGGGAGAGAFDDVG